MPELILSVFRFLRLLLSGNQAVALENACGPQKLNPGAFHRTKSQLLGERACDIVTDVTET